jgi:hypothetical protein
MSEPPPSPETGNDADHGPGGAPAGGPARWVVVIGIAVAVAVLGLIIFLHLSGAIGPGIH